MRKISIVTGTRADYGLLYWIIKGIQEDTDLELQLVVTGMHLSPEFGLTVKDIENDGFPIAERVEMLLSSDTETAIATSMGLGMIGFAKAYERLKPDILVVLGDRFEIFSAVASAVPLRIIVAHIHGGESTEGLIDEPIRHAVTKMSHIHFASTERYKKRIIQMGESPETVYCFGAPGIDNVYKLDLMNRQTLSRELNIPQTGKIGIVTYHPVTLEMNTSEDQSVELLKGLKAFPDIYWIFTLPNSDTGGRIIMKKIEDFLNENPERGRAFTSLGTLKYLSLLKNSDVMVGNSSSGLTEAPSFELPVVNIGDRQRGRVRAKNLIDVQECNEGSIKDAIRKVTSNVFRESLRGVKNPYGTGGSSKKIVNRLKSLTLDGKLVKKRFYDLL